MYGLHIAKLESILYFSQSKVAPGLQVETLTSCIMEEGLKDTGKLSTKFDENKEELLKPIQNE